LWLLVGVQEVAEMLVLLMAMVVAQGALELVLALQ
jgi:hypothetical protein